MNKIFLNKKNKFIIFSLIFIFIFLFLPQTTKGAWYDFLIGAVTFVPSVFIALVCWVFVMITALFSSFAGLILKWVSSKDFVSFSYTRPGFDYTKGDNPIIAEGLKVTMNLANAFLILVLVYIGLAIILRISGYETKKLLVKFIIIALLVNFSPVMCGLIVDASNFLMYMFTEKLTGGKQLINALRSIIDAATGNFNWQIFKVTAQIKIISYFLMIAIFNLLTAIALFLFAAIFLVRYIAIWILVILSPLAFVAYILPQTEKYFRTWWNQFLQWSFIGATCGFFLYLGERISALGPSLFKSPTGELGTALLPYAVPIAFLYLGLIFGFSTGAIGASTVIGLAKKYGRKGLGYGYKGAKLGVARAISSQWAERHGVKEKLNQWATKPLSLPSFKDKSTLGKIGTALGYATSITPIMWALRRGAGEASLRLTESGKKDVVEAQNKYKGKEATDLLAAIRDLRLGWSHRIAALLQAIEEGKLGDLKKLGLSDSEIINIGKAALRLSPETFKPIRDAFPHLAEAMGEGFSTKTRHKAGVMSFDEHLNELRSQANVLDNQIRNMAPGLERTKLMEERKKIHNLIMETINDKKIYGTIEAKIIAKLKPTFILKTDESILKTPEAEYAMHKFWDGNQFAAAANSFGRSFINRFNTVAQSNMKKDPNYYKNNNPLLYQYSRSTPGISLGMIQLN